MNQKQAIQLLKKYSTDEKSFDITCKFSKQLIDAGVTFISPLINKHGINTNLTPEKVDDIVGVTTIKFMRWLKNNYRLIEVRKSYLEAIATQFEYFLELILSRSINDLQRKHISERIKLTGSVQPQQQPSLP